MSLGEARVRISFNPNDNSSVNDVKRRAADLIDWINDLPVPAKVAEDPVARGEFFRLKALAMTAIEEGAMWAVKAATI